jgi:hypothetical protein
MYSMLTLLGVNKKKVTLKSGDIAALKLSYVKEFNEISPNDQLSVKSIHNDIVEVSFISTKTKTVYTRTLPKTALVKIS